MNVEKCAILIIHAVPENMEPVKDGSINPSILQRICYKMGSCTFTSVSQIVHKIKYIFEVLAQVGISMQVNIHSLYSGC